MLNTKNLRFKCVHCGNCCKDEKTIVNITYHDVLRIKNGLKLTLDEIIQILGFYIIDKGISNKNRKRMVISPIETQKGPAFVGLFKKDNGICYFYDLNRKRCSIYNLRPMFCRTFPFTFKYESSKSNQNIKDLKIDYTEKSKEYCLGLGEESPLINLSKWMKLGEKALESIKENYQFFEKWNEGVKDGSFIPTVRNFIQNVLRIETPIDLE